MELYLAPMEALTGYVYRNVYHRHFFGADKFFTPFIAGKKLSSKEKNDVLPEHNTGMKVVPQILTNKAEEFCYIAQRLREYYGYEEVNFNLGCPSGTVTAKKRGAGFLKVLDELDAFFDIVFSKCDMKISVKTRTGVDNSDNFENIVELYNRYPLSELIVHPRCIKDAYNKKADTGVFDIAYEKSRHPLIYNGDINNVDDYNNITQKYPQLKGVMCGRGILVNPALFSQIRGKEGITREKLREFVKDVYLGYKEVMSGERNVLFKLKELWIYLSKNFDEPDKVLKMIRKTESCLEYEAAVNKIFSLP